MADNTAQQFMFPMPGEPRLPKRSVSRLTLVLWLIGIFIAEGVASGVTWPTVLRRIQALSTSQITTSIVGTIVFVHSTYAPPNSFDQLRMDLKNIPSPPAGTTYYAWLEISGSNFTVYPHWQFRPTNGFVHYLYPGSAQHSDLFAKNSLFLITVEDANSSPILPIPVLSRHLYYAKITHTSTKSQTFEVKLCAQRSSSKSTNPC